VTDTLQEHADPTLHKGETLVQLLDVGKTYGAIRALKGINMTVNAGEVTCAPGCTRTTRASSSSTASRGASPPRGSRWPPGSRPSTRTWPWSR
jgi:hypothetical protein